MRLANRVAIITGGASGMGLASVFRYLDEGARVVVADFNETTGAAAIAAATAKGYADQVSFFRTDVASEDDIANLVDHTFEPFRPAGYYVQQRWRRWRDRTPDRDHGSVLGLYFRRVG